MKVVARAPGVAHRFGMSRRAWLLLLAVAACEKAESSTSREERDEVPPPPKPVEKKLLRYNASHVSGYSFAIELASKPNAPKPLSGNLTFDLGFVPAANAQQAREVRFDKVAIKAHAEGEDVELTLDDTTLVMKSSKSAPQTLPRSTLGLDATLTTMTFADDHVSTQANLQNAMASILGDVFESAFVVFPGLPKEAIGVGHRWTVTRKLALLPTYGKLDVTYSYEYVGDEKCPSGAVGSQSCAVLAFVVPRATVSLTTPPVGKATFSLNGRVHFDPVKGRVDASRFAIDLDVDTTQTQLPLKATIAMTAR